MTAFGWIPDRPDPRDLVFQAPMRGPLPPSCALQHAVTFDQGKIGSCVAQSCIGVHHYEQVKAGIGNPFIGSRLQVYYLARAYDGMQNVDSGTSIRNGVKALVQYGAAPESLWPYSDDPMQYRVEPPKNVVAEAEKSQIIEYRRVQQSLDQLRGCLVSGHPFVFGFTVFKQAIKDADTTGVYSIRQGDRPEGGHAVFALGYDDTRQVFTIQNSWGKDWGINGRFYMPYSVIANPKVCQDFWMMSKVELPDQPPTPPAPSPNTIRVSFPGGRIVIEGGTLE